MTSKFPHLSLNLNGPNHLSRWKGRLLVHIGPSDYVAWLDDRKWAYVRLEGSAFGEVPLSLEYKLEVWDSPNSAGIIIDAIRCAKIAKDRGVGGPILSAATYVMKSPPVQMEDTLGREELEKFISGENERQPLVLSPQYWQAQGRVTVRWPGLVRRRASQHSHADAPSPRDPT